MLSNKYSPLIFALFGGVAMSLGWPMSSLTPLLFFGFASILALEEYFRANPGKRSGWKFFGYTYLTFLIWNALTTWWIYNVHPIAGIFAITANALLMSVPMVLFRLTRNWAGSYLGYIAFVTYWIGFEYLHLNWELTWPWLTLGNGFAARPSWVQWYEYTGVLGGSLWILLVTVFSWHYVIRGLVFKAFKPRPISFVYLALLIGLPILLSIIRYNGYSEKGEPREVVVVQPNVDPFNEKFEGTPEFIPIREQVKRLVRLSLEKITENTDYIVWPETSFDIEHNSLWLDQINEYPEIKELKDLLKAHPRMALLMGAATFQSYPDRSTPTARHSPYAGFYDVFNTAIHINHEGDLQYYHKSKLVPGVERMPYPAVFRVLENLVIDLGGASGSCGTQEERTVFTYDEGYQVAPCVCYESIFGEFMSRFVENGAEVIFIITNDGWWGNTPGHRQHLAYASLLAIELRRSIARSANTGISAFINQRGDISQPTRYWEETSLNGAVRLNKEVTYYAKNGDYIGRLSAFVAIALLLSAYVKNKTGIKKR